MKAILLVILFLGAHWPVSAHASQTPPSPSLAKLFVGNRGYIVLAKLNDPGKLDQQLERSDVDIVVRSKLDPEHPHGYIIARVTVEKVLTNAAKPKSIDVAVPVVKINDKWQPLLDTKALRNRAYFLIDETTVGLQMINSLMLARVYSDAFEMELMKEIAAVDPLRRTKAAGDVSE